MHWAKVIFQHQQLLVIQDGFFNSLFLTNLFMNYYEILEIKHNASAQEIKQAYRRLAKKFHPDSQNNNADHEKNCLFKCRL